jgi:DNA-binding NarL/FixJ family response regulator
LLSALVVDADPQARGRTADLLCLAGWQVHEAHGITDAVQQAAVRELDLVVTDLLGSAGPALLRRLRTTGSRARFLVVADDVTAAVRAEAAAAGALAVSKPLGPRFLLDFLRSRTTGPAAQDLPSAIHDVDDLDDDDLDAALMDRLQEMYVNALPGRLSAITSGARSGDVTALASAAHTLAGTSGQLGHPEVASVCQAIAADARRGILAHSRLVQLRDLARV